MTLQDCDHADARARLVDAQDFFAVAQITDNPDVIAANAVLAGIAAADVICCVALGHHSRSLDHAAAIGLLRTAKDRQSANQLDRLLSVKSRSQYDVRSLTEAQAAQALARAGRLVDKARVVFAAAEG